MAFKSFKNKLFVFCILVLVIQTTVTGFLYYNLSIRSLKEKVYNSYASIAESMGKSLDSRLERIEWYMMSVLTNSSLQTLIKETDFNNTGAGLFEFSRTINLYMNSIVYNEMNLVSSFLVPLKTTIVYPIKNNKFISINDASDERGLLQFSKTVQLNGKNNWIGFITQNGQRYFGISRLIRDVTTRNSTQNPLAVIYLFFSEKMISEPLTTMKIEEESSLVIIDENSDSILSVGTEVEMQSLNEILAERTEADPNVFEHTINNKNMLVSYYTLQNRPWKAVYLVPYSNAFIQTRYIIFSTIILTLLIFITFAAASYIFTGSVTRPLKRLDKGFQQLESGNFDVKVKKSSEDELGRIIDSFHRMTGKIKEMFEKTVADEKLKREYEIRSLQYQINPHFLYNTLNSIRLMALLSKNSSIANALDALIKFLRNVVGRKEPLITLEEEIENIRLYIAIQNIRYNDSIEVQYNIEEDLNKCKIPCFILQPIVENAIFHGIEPKRSGILKIEISSNDGTLYINVVDNGVGMTEQQIVKIFDPNYDEDTLNHIGLNNVDKRIKLHFGEQYGLTIESEYGHETSVMVKIPQQ
ncbi:MAG: sensor histidine kinase [Clostridiaceae bacterium]